MTEKLILKYLNPSSATAKGHMKSPRQGIRSTTPWIKRDGGIQQIEVAPISYGEHVMQPPDGTNAESSKTSETNEVDDWDFPAFPPPAPVNLIADDESNPSNANVFAYGAFADKHSGVVYHDLTRVVPIYIVGRKRMLLCPISL